MSATYPKVLRDLLVFYYQRYYHSPASLADGHHPPVIESDSHQSLCEIFSTMDRTQGFEYLQQKFTEQGFKLPVLFKQYAALYEDGGYQLLAFSVDSEFGNCVDGLFMGDLNLMKANKRQRYLMI